MSGLTITGSGRYLPGRAYTNDDLARVMETNDEWVQKRTGIAARHYCPEGVGVSDLALPAAQAALHSAGRSPEDVDYVLFNTMTPDHVFPGSAPLLATKLGCRGIPALDLRTQCAAMIYSLQLAHGLVSAGAARSILIVGAEAHAGFMPWRDWDVLEGTKNEKPSDADWQRATRHRGLAVLFGDGAGAFLVEKSDRQDAGVLAVDLHSDGRFAKKLNIPAGFRTRPFISQRTVDEDLMIPTMDGREVFRQAIDPCRARCAPCARRRACGSTRSTGSSRTKPTSGSTTPCARSSKCRLKRFRPTSNATATHRRPRSRSCSTRCGATAG
jgi:3-oxoacyl-[acyl-carrier-protein] synthase-3